MKRFVPSGVVLDINTNNPVDLFARSATIGDRLLIFAIVLQFISLTISAFVFEQQFESQTTVQTVARNIGIVREFLFFSLLAITVFVAGDGFFVTSAVLLALTVQYIFVTVATEAINGGENDVWDIKLVLGYTSTLYRLGLFTVREIARFSQYGAQHQVTWHSGVLFLAYYCSGSLLWFWGVSGVMSRFERTVDTAMKLFLELPCAAISPPRILNKEA